MNQFADLFRVFALAFFCCSPVNSENSFEFVTNQLPDDLNFMPTLGNGHLGFTVFSDSVYMNGLYNGHKGLSHRARIPNLNNIQLQLCSATNYDKENCFFSLNVKQGIFKTVYTDPDYRFKIEQTIYAHRYFNRVIVNDVNLIPLNSRDEIVVNLFDDNRLHPADAATIVDDVTFNFTKTVFMKNSTVHINCGSTIEVEDEKYQSTTSEVCVLWNHLPKTITLRKFSKNNVSLKFLMVVDSNLEGAKQEMMDVIGYSSDVLLEKHTKEWKSFWNDFNIHVEGNIQLSSIIHASLFYLTSSLPSLVTNQKNNVFYGLSPTGLGRGGTNLNDYEGHTFWDSEIWMQPVIGLIHPEWLVLLLHYRFLKLEVAKDHARSTGYAGARFPWESAFTGSEVTQPCCPSVAKNQIHITADISLAIRYYFALTHALTAETCELSNEISKFWLSRVAFNSTTGYYDIKEVMGPDEDNENVDNNVFTNAVAGYAIYFGRFSQCVCKAASNATEWDDVAKHIRLLYDAANDYHPQFEGYKLGTTIKQADVILLNYPLQYKMKESTRLNDLNFYENVTRESGPAMTWAIAAIGHFDSADIDSNTKAAKMFNRSYKPYVRGPFHVWSEVIESEKGAVNFLTGIGGFLQAVINGYAGIRIGLSNMTISVHSQLLPNTSNFSINGFVYLGSKFKLAVETSRTVLTCLKMNKNYPLKIKIGDAETGLIENIEYAFENQKVVLTPIQNTFEGCTIPEDVIGIKKTENLSINL